MGLLGGMPIHREIRGGGNSEVLGGAPAALRLVVKGGDRRGPADNKEIFKVEAGRQAQGAFWGRNFLGVATVLSDPAGFLPATKSDGKSKQSIIPNKS